MNHCGMRRVRVWPNDEGKKNKQEFVVPLSLARNSLKANDENWESKCLAEIRQKLDAEEDESSMFTGSGRIKALDHQCFTFCGIDARKKLCLWPSNSKVSE